jgi:hypothetical protein
MVCAYAKVLGFGSGFVRFPRLLWHRSVGPGHRVVDPAEVIAHFGVDLRVALEAALGAVAQDADQGPAAVVLVPGHLQKSAGNMTNKKNNREKFPPKKTSAKFDFPRKKMQKSIPVEANPLIAAFTTPTLVLFCICRKASVFYKMRKTRFENHIAYVHMQAFLSFSTTASIVELDPGVDFIGQQANTSAYFLTNSELMI